MKISSKIAVGALSLALAFSVSSVASAQTTMSFADLINAFVKAGIISADKAAQAQAIVSMSASTSFTKDLTVGSTGTEVTALQNAIGVTPATGYFGSLTKAAVQKYQASKGISATGFVGPLTRAALNASVTTTTTTTTTTTGGSTVVNSGVEGTLTADRFSISNTTAYEGDSMVPVLAVKLQAKLSDITVQRIKLDLGQSTSIYTKVFKTLYVVDDAGNVVAKADLNSNTVVKNGTQYELTFGGFSYNVPKDSSKVLTIKGDLYSSIKDADQGSKTIRLATDDSAIRGVDGAGIDQYAGGTSISQNITISTTLADSASLNLSTNSSNYKTTEVVASNGSAENELDKLALLAFDLKANKADLDVTDLAVRFTTSGVATATTAYLYDGSTLIATESVNGGVASFTDSNQLFTVAKDSTKTITVKADIRSATSTATTFSARVQSADISAENVAGESKSTSGSATGENMVVRNVGPVFSLLSKNVSVSGTNNSGSTLSTSTITATFSLQVQALGGDIMFGSQASSTNPMFAFKTYDVAGAAVTGVSSTTGFSIPSSGVVTPVNGDTNSFIVQENNTVTLNPITVTIAGKDTAGNPRNAIAVAIDSIKWIGTSGVIQTSNFMSGKTEWRTNTQTP